MLTTMPPKDSAIEVIEQLAIAIIAIAKCFFYLVVLSIGLFRKLHEYGREQLPIDIAGGIALAKFLKSWLVPTCDSFLIEQIESLPFPPQVEPALAMEKSKITLTSIAADEATSKDETLAAPKPTRTRSKKTATSTARKRKAS